MSSLFQSVSVVVLFVCALGILLAGNWRWMTGLAALQYIGVFSLVSISWPVEIAVVKLVAGWMATAVLILTFVNIPRSAAEAQVRTHLPGTFFKGFAALLIGISVFSLVPIALRWFLGATNQQALGGLILLGLGWVPVLGTLLKILAAMFWVFLMVRAYSGQIYKVPFIGSIANDVVKRSAMNRASGQNEEP